jgi:hypothetical protein
MSANIGQTSNFSPNQISGCQLWLDAADPTSITTSGTTVTGVTDKSGTNKVITVTNTVSYVNKESFVFTNTTGVLNITGMPAAPYDFITVATANSATNIFRTLLRTASIPGTHPFLLQVNTNNLGMWNGSAFHQFGSLTFSPNEKALAYATMASGRTIQASKNGVESLTVSSPAGNESVITVIGNSSGSGGQPWGTLQEIVLFNRTLLISERQQLEGYLAWKWGLNRSLPTTHPYYNTPVYSLNMPNVIFPLYSYPIPLFQPTFFSNCTLWLDAADRSTFTMNDTLTITQWRDKSGLANHASNVGTLRLTSRIGNLPAITYPGLGNTYFIGPLVNSGSTMTSFAVFLMNSSSWTSARVLSLSRIGTPDFNNSLFTAAISRFNANFVSFRAGSSRGSIAATFGSAVQNATVFTGASNTYYQNGTAGTTVASTGNFGYSNYEVGGSFGEESLVPLNGSVGEVIHYNSALNTTQRQQIEGYLAWKWGLEASLPSNHPYKSFAFETLPPFPEVTLSKSATNGRLLPNSFGNLSIWFDATDATTLGLSGNNVTSWTSKGLNSVVVSQSTNRPTYISNVYKSLPTIRFNFNTTLPLSNASVANSVVQTSLSYTIFVVHTPNANNSTPFAYLTGGGSRLSVHTPENANVIFDGIGARLTYAYPSQAAYLNGALRMESFYSISSTGFYRRDGSQLATGNLGSGTYNSTQNFFIGGAVPNFTGYSYGGDICEVLWYNVGLTANQILQIEGYLAWKWGLVGSLPSTHPYKLFPPSP